MRALAKLCSTVDGELRFVGRPPLVTPIEDVLPGRRAGAPRGHVRRMIATYSRSLPRDRRNLLESYRYVHAARKVVGVGSVGDACLDPAAPRSRRIRSPVPPVQGGAALGARAVPRRSEFDQHGQRVVEGQRMMQAASDIMLGWERVITIDGEKKDFYIRQLWDAKGPPRSS